MAEDDVGFRINKDFAKKYDEYRRKEELQKLKDRYGDVDVDASSSSSSETEDEDAVELTPAIEKGFLKTLAALKSKDPRIYQQDVNFYDEDKKAESGKAEGKGKKPKEKPMFLKDYERKVLLEKGGVPSDEESSDDESAMKKPTSPSYYEEQEQIKQSFKQALSAGDGDDDDDDEDGSLLVERQRTQEELDEDERDYKAWLSGQKEELANKYKDMGPLKQYWTNPELDKGEAFLRDYILNQEYRDPDKDRIPTYDEIVDDEDDIDYSEDEEYLEKAENFERKFNFRYEEPDAEFIKSYPRTIASSVRRKDERRKKKREETRERKKQEKHKKKDELRQLKNLKKKEILDKLDHLKEITGNKDVGFNQADLEGDFDPKKYDEMMQNVFNEDYYGEEEGEKPEFPEEEDLEEDVNWDQWQGPDGEGEGDEYEYDWENGQEGEEPHCEDPDFNMDADYNPDAQQSTSQEILAMSKKKKRRRKLGTYFAEAVNKKKPVFDPNDKTFEEYLSEYYKLDYEDVIGDMPCRFKYRNVMANDFGLTTEEVLTAADRELNSWCSVKAMSKYRTEEEENRELKRYKKKGKDTRKKHRILASLSKKIDENEEEEEDAAAPKTSPEVPKKRKDRPELSQDTGEVTKKQKTDSKAKPETVSPTECSEETEVVEREEDKSANGGSEDANAATPKKKKRRRRQRKRKLTHGDGTPATDNNPTQTQDTTEKNGKEETRSSDVSDVGKTVEDVNEKDNNKEKKKKKQKAVARVQGKKKQPPKMSAERIKAYGFNPKKFKYILQNQKKKQKKELST